MATIRSVLEEAAPRAILCEKPMGFELAQGAAIEHLCHDRKCNLYVNYMRRSDPGAVEVRRRLDSGEVQTPVRGVVWYSKGLMNNGSHFFNLLQYWLGSMQDFAIIRSGRLWAGEDPEPDVQVAFDGGVVTFLAAKEEDFSHYEVELVARNGKLRYVDGGRTILWRPAVPDPALEGYTVLRSIPEIIESDMNRSQWNVAAQLAEALDGRSAHLCDGSDGLRTLEALSLIRGKLR
jgi:predicted dehydrogenase